MAVAAFVGPSRRWAGHKGPPYDPYP